MAIIIVRRAALALRRRPLPSFVRHHTGFLLMKTPLMMRVTDGHCDGGGEEHAVWV